MGRTVCANIDCGKTGLQARFDAISARLEHLYSVQGINRDLGDASLDDVSVQVSPFATTIKKEDPEALESLERLTLSDQRSPASASAVVNGSPMSRRSWKQDIVRSLLSSPFPLKQRPDSLHGLGQLDRANASNGGRITKLSLEESLALQQKESDKVQAERLAGLQREEAERLLLSRLSSGKHRRGIPGKTVS